VGCGGGQYLHWCPVAEEGVDLADAALDGQGGGDRTSEDVAVPDHGLVLPAGLTRTGPDYVSLPGFVGLSGKTTWCTRPDGLV
jgi:hypothetical protein